MSEDRVNTERVRAARDALAAALSNRASAESVLATLDNARQNCISVRSAADRLSLPRLRGEAGDVIETIEALDNFVRVLAGMEQER